MAESSIDEVNAIAKAQQIARLRILRDAFVAVFGPPGAPTVPGALVLDYLDHFCKRSAFSIALDNSGQTDVSRTFARMGLRQAADEIHRLISWREGNHADSSTGA